MAATGELVVLPMLSPLRVALPQGNPIRYRRPLQTWQPRLYRLPPKESAVRYPYGPNGQAFRQSDRGLKIDLYA